MRQVADCNFLNQLIDDYIDYPVLLSLINFKVLSTSVRHMYPFLIPKNATPIIFKTS